MAGWEGGGCGWMGRRGEMMHEKEVRVTGIEEVKIMHRHEVGMAG